MRTIGVVSIVTAAFAAAMVSAGSALADPTAGGSCTQVATGSITVSAGGPTAGRPYSARGTANDFTCTTSDPTIHAAKEAYSQTGSFVCLPLSETSAGTDTFTWSNGRTSVMRYTDKSFGDVVFTSGDFVSGEFAGLHASWIGSGVPFTDPLGTLLGSAKVCGLGQAVTAPFDYAGAVVFGTSAHRTAHVPARLPARRRTAARHRSRAVD